MLARTSRLYHPALRYQLETPALVPSFSSKGFGFDGRGRSELVDVLRPVSEMITDYMLVSAYDLYHEHLPPIEEFAGVPQFLFIDSGGYETSSGHDPSTPYHFPYEPKDWNPEMLCSILNSLPEGVATVITNYDDDSIRVPLEDQIVAAREFLSRYPAHLRNFLIKPSKPTARYVTRPELVAYAAELGTFDIIGVTEKELGGSILQRMHTIAAFRKALDQEQVKVPIHVYGSLDPLTSCLYFLAGAEIFDGLTWLRYAFRDGMAIYPANYGVLQYGVQELHAQILVQSITQNLHSLRKLELAMERFCADGDYSHFGPHNQSIKEAHQTLLARIGGS